MCVCVCVCNNDKVNKTRWVGMAMVVDDARSVHFSDPETQTELLQVLRTVRIVESGPGNGASLQLLQLSGAMTNVIYHCSVFLRGSEHSRSFLCVFMVAVRSSSLRGEFVCSSAQRAWF